MGETGCSRRRKDSRNYIRNNIDIYVCEVHRLTEFTAPKIAYSKWSYCYVEMYSIQQDIYR